MNSPLNSILLALLVVLGLPNDSRAMPPRTRQREGVIKSIDPQTRSFVFEGADKSVPHVITWSRRTDFYEDGQEIEPSALHPAQRIELRYGAPFFGPPYAARTRVLSLSPQPTTRKTKP